MITLEMKYLVNDKITECIKKFKDKTGFTLEFPDIRYDLKGCTAGQAHYGKYQEDAYIRLNSSIFKDNTDKFVERTVPHEVAHLLARYYFLKMGIYKIKPHGKEWRNIMKILGVNNITRCHSYTIKEDQRKRQQRYSYKCNCKTFALSSTRHNRILKGKCYICTDCRNKLVYEGIML
jgi:SprT protein